MLGEQKDPQKVGVDQMARLGFAGVEQRFGNQRAGIIDEHVNRANGSCQLADRRRVSLIEDEGLGAQLGGERLDGFGLDISEHQRRTLRVKTSGGRLSKAVGSPRDQYPPTGEIK